MFAGSNAGSPAVPIRDAAEFAGGRRTRRRTLKAKTLRRMLKKKGLKTTGKKSTLMKRLHLRGGSDVPSAASGSAANPGADYASQVAKGLPTGGRRRRY